MATSVFTVDGFVLTSTTNGMFVGPANNAIVVSAVAHNVTALNHTLTLYRVIQGGVTATNNSLGGTLIPAGGAPVIVTVLAGQGVTAGGSIYAVADTTNAIVLNATWATTS